MSNIDAAAARPCSWFGYSWDGISEGRLPPGFKPGSFNGAGHKIFQGRKDDVRDIIREIIRLAEVKERA